MAAIIKMSQNEWVKFFMQSGWIQDGRIEDGCHHQIESEWMSEVFFVQNGWIQRNGRIQYGWHYQVEWEWMSEDFYLFKMAESKIAEFKMPDIIKLSENEWVWIRSNLVWVRILCKRADSKIGEFTMDPSTSWVRIHEWSFFCSKWLTRRKQNSRWLTSSTWVRMNEFESDWISLSESVCAKWLNPWWQCLNPTWQNSTWLPSSSWVRIHE